MSVQFNQSWIGVDGSPVTGRVPASMAVRFELVPGSNPPRKTPEVPAFLLGSVYHAYKLFCDAIAVTPNPGGFHVQNRTFQYEINDLPRTARLRMTSIAEVHQVSLVVPVHEDDDLRLNYWAGYFYTDYDTPAPEATFEVVKFDKALTGLKKVLRRKWVLAPTVFQAWAYCQAVAEDFVYWVKAETGTSVELTDEQYTSSLYGYTVKVFAVTRRMTLFRSKGTEDVELGFFQTVDRTRRPYAFVGGVWVEYFGIIETGDRSTRLDITSEGILGVGATKWGMLVIDQFAPSNQDNVWSHERPTPSTNRQRRSYYADPLTLEPIAVEPPEPATYAVDWSGSDFTPPVAETAYTENEVKEFLASFRWNRNAAWSISLAGSPPQVPPDPRSITIPQAPMLWAQYVNWISGGYVAPRYTDQTFGPANHRALFKFGEASPYRLIDMTVFGPATPVRSDYLYRGLWADEFVLAPRVIGEDLSICLRKYSSPTVEKRLVILAASSMPASVGASYVISEVRVGQDAIEVAQL